MHILNKKNAYKIMDILIYFFFGVKSASMSAVTDD